MAREYRRWLRWPAFFLAGALLSPFATRAVEVSEPEQTGLDQGFAAPPSSVAPDRIVYVVSLQSLPRHTVAQFIAWVGADGCALALGDNNEPIGVAAYTIRGRLVRGGGRVRIDARTNAATGPLVASAQVELRGSDAAAVTRATRQMLQRLGLVCRL